MKKLLLILSLIIVSRIVSMESVSEDNSNPNSLVTFLKMPIIDKSQFADEIKEEIKSILLPFCKKIRANIFEKSIIKLFKLKEYPVLNLEEAYQTVLQKTDLIDEQYKFYETFVKASILTKQPIPFSHKEIIRTSASTIVFKSRILENYLLSVVKTDIENRSKMGLKTDVPEELRSML